MIYNGNSSSARNQFGSARARVGLGHRAGSITTLNRTRPALTVANNYQNWLAPQTGDTTTGLELKGMLRSMANLAAGKGMGYHAHFIRYSGSQHLWGNETNPRPRFILPLIADPLTPKMDPVQHLSGDHVRMGGRGVLCVHVLLKSAPTCCNWHTFRLP